MRILIEAFDRQFLKIHTRSRQLLTLVNSVQLFENIGQTPALISETIGENVLRSAAMVEMTFGGITTRLWDDPFEWTLPEELATTEKIAEYLDEVEKTRLHGFGYFSSDSDLSRSIPAPRELRTIVEILIETIASSAHHQGRAFAIFRSISGEKPPRL